MLRLRPSSEQALDAATWAARHRLMFRVLVAQAVVLVVWAALVGRTPEADLAHVALIAGAGGVAAWSGAGRTVQAAAMALALFTESALAVHLADGAVAIHFHYFVMLCLLAQYEDAAPFGLGVAYVVIQHGLMGSMSPSGVYGRGPEADHPWLWAMVHGAFIVAASAALVAGWRANARLRVRDRRSRDAAERHLRDLMLLRRLAQDVASRDDAREAVVSRLREMTHADVAFLLEPSGDTLVVSAATGDVPAEVTPPDAADRALASAAVVHASAGPLAVTFEPVLIDDVPVAVLAAGWSSGSARDARTAHLLALAAEEAAVALERLTALRRLEEAALTDALTGVANRRAFDAELPQALVRAMRSGEPLSLAMMDLDDFKALNDREGHDAGDQFLQAAASAWSAELRASDVLARLGGDEFAVILPGSGADDADRLAARLLDALPHGPGCGVGIVAWDRHEDAAALAQRADRALYVDKARRSARRRVASERPAAR